MGIKEGALALADELEAFEDGDCEECSLYGQPECKGHLSCMEIMARYAARKMREAVERDGEGATTVSAYDLLSDEDREALAWVREHGGLDEVEKRIMPEGMEWPKVDGKPVDFKTGYEPSLGVLEAVSIYSNGACQVMSHDGIIKSAKDIHIVKPKVLDADGVEIREGDVLYRKSDGRMVEVAEVYEKTFIDADDYVRPGDGFTHRAPVLVADGKPLEVGQTVWHVGNGVEFTVIGLPNPGEYQAVKLRLDDGAFTGLDPDQLTHQRPVLDADGVPIKVGDTVWDTETGCGRTVRAVNDNETVEFDGYENRGWFGKFLTHAKPERDSWQRIEEDKGLNPFDYCKKVGHKLWTFDNAEEFKASDLVRRCRALAERGA